MSFAYPVENETEIKEILDDLRKTYHDARHHCYAWRLGAEKKNYRFNDDGEPSNSAGKPIYGQILSNDLTDILIVVIRYFGGILLGVGGLITAYRESAADAIHNNHIVEKKVYETFSVRFNYPQMNNVMTIIKDHNVDQFDQDFSLKCSLKLKIWIKESEMVTGKLKILEDVIVDKLTI